MHAYVGLLDVFEKEGVVMTSISSRQEKVRREKLRRLTWDVNEVGWMEKLTFFIGLGRRAGPRMQHNLRGL
jgi:hypothetical protein